MDAPTASSRLPTKHPRCLDHTPGLLRELADFAGDISHERDFDQLQTIANLLSDWADEIEGVKHSPKPILKRK